MSEKHIALHIVSKVVEFAKKNNAISVSEVDVFIPNNSTYDISLIISSFDELKVAISLICSANLVVSKKDVDQVIVDSIVIDN